MSNKLPYETLQCHTIFSDGDLTHEQVLDQCLRHKIGIVAFTDHDALIDKAKLDALKQLNHPVKFLSAVELSVHKLDGLGEFNVDSFHIIGLFVDPTNKDLVELCDTARQSRRIRAQGYINGLKEVGFKVEIEDVKSLATGGLISMTHISNATIAKPENIRLLELFLQKLRKLAENDEKAKEKLKTINPTNYFKLLFWLFLGDDAAFPIPKQPRSYTLSLSKACQLIRGAGGLSVFAHWSDYRSCIDEKVLEKMCSEKRVDGLETVFGYGHTSEWEDYVKGIQAAKALNSKYNLISAGGGDFHTVADFDDFENARNIDLNNDTIGMTKRILELHPQVNLTWSSLSR